MKKLSLLLTLVFLLTLLVGCGNAATPTEPASDAPVSTEAVQPVPTTAGPADTTPPDTQPADSTQDDTTPADTEPADPTPIDADAVHPMLFRVTGEDGQEGLLFGTIHVGDERIDTALQKLIPYLDGCEALAVEFDLVAYESDLAAQVKSMQQFVLSDGTRISDHMPKETFEKASALLDEAGLSPRFMEMYNLSMWSTLVEQAALITRTDFDMEIGMDRSLIRHCYDKQIEVRDVESAELQYSLLASFSDELNLLLIENTLDNLDEYGEEVQELYDAWLKGNYEELAAVLEDEEDESETELTEAQIALLEDYNDKMLTQRNLGMRDKAVEWLKAGDKVFFAVGAAHLIGEDGLVELLRAEGYTVEQLEY
ncbi:MAG: TraB/GumN family protein [Oscillospiraceae bacterium]|nr:TraB/GumN family protein [Oscillospiraceae bacterium]